MKPTASVLKPTPLPHPPVRATISLNGGTAHLGRQGDLLTIMSFAVVDEREAANWQPRVLLLAEANTKIIKVSKK